MHFMQSYTVGVSLKLPSAFSFFNKTIHLNINSIVMGKLPKNSNRKPIYCGLRFEFLENV